MKTNFIKKGSEKSIKMFQMSNEELATVNGGRYEVIRDENGELILVWINKISTNHKSFRFRD